MSRPILVVLIASLTAACALDLTGPRANLQGLPDGLDVRFTVKPAEVGQHAPFTAHLEVTNTTSDVITVTTAHGCLVIPGVYRNGERVPFRGSGWGCYAAITTHTFQPGETKERTWEMRAELYAEHPGDVDGAPAPKGSYHVRAEFDTVVGPGGQKPAVEASLRVR